MRKVAVATGVNSSGRTLVLLTFSERSTLEAFKIMVRVLQDRHVLPANAFTVSSPLNRTGGQLLVVLPASRKVGLHLRDLREKAAVQLQLDLASTPMSWADYEVYDRIAARHSG